MLGRSPDASGLANYQRLLANGKDRGALLLDFSESPETEFSLLSSLIELTNRIRSSLRQPKVKRLGRNTVPSLRAKDSTGLRTATQHWLPREPVIRALLSSVMPSAIELNPLSRQGCPGDDVYVPLIHLCPDGRGHLPQADPRSSHHCLERAGGGPVDGRPHGIQMTPTGVDPNIRRILLAGHSSVLCFFVCLIDTESGSSAHALCSDSP